MLKVKLKKLSNNEAVGDNATHFFKSRSFIRSTSNKNFLNASKHIPKQWNNLPVSYDIWWDTKDNRDENGIPVLTGFSYTDFITRCVFFRPTNSILGLCHLTNILSTHDKIDKKYTDNIINNIADKYRFNGNTSTIYPTDVIFLPGTNLLERNYVDYNKVRELAKNGALVKPHPLTTRYHLEMLRCMVGESNLIGIYESGINYLKNSERVYSCTNSELGLVGILLDKEVNSVEIENPPFSFGGFESIYKSTQYNKQNLLKLMSCEYSGIVNIDNQFVKRMKNFLFSFNFFARDHENTN